MNVSRDTVYKWCRRAKAEPEGTWWLDRSSRPHRSPAKTRRKLERKILSLRRNKKLGPARIAGRLELPASTVHAVLARNDMSRLAWMDRPTGRVIRRYEHPNPGDLVHVDIKKLGKVPPGGGWRAHGRQARPARHRKIGYCYVHSAVDDHSRLAYSEIHDDEQAVTAVGFWQRARAFFAQHGIVVRAVLTDNGPATDPRTGSRSSSPAVPSHAAPSPTAPDQRQGRTLQPHPPRGMGLRPRLQLRSRTTTTARQLAAHLQPSPLPHRPRGPTTDHPRRQPPWALQLAVMAGQVVDDLDR
jgi:hypothetical protein